MNWKNRHGSGSRLSSGTVMIEFVMALPAIVFIAFLCVQVAHLYLAKLVVHYAAYCSARAMLVSHRDHYRDAAQRAAEQVCQWVVVVGDGRSRDREIPGWGPIPGSSGVGSRTHVSCREAEWNVAATVELDFALVTPLAGPALAWGRAVLDHRGPERRGRDRYPHIRLKETVWLPKPYVTTCR